jgi:hypothetical protein
MPALHTCSEPRTPIRFAATTVGFGSEHDGERYELNSVSLFEELGLTP